MGKQGDLGDFECGMDVGASLDISETDDLKGFSHTSPGLSENVSEKEKYPASGCSLGKYRRGQRTMARVFQDDREDTVTQTLRTAEV